MNRRQRIGILLLSQIPLFLVSPVASAEEQAAIGAVYTMTNGANGNEILVFNRDKEGKLESGSAFSTGGLGTGTGLGSQGALVLDPANRWLFAVNADSDDISVFEVQENGLSLIDRVASNGRQPISLTFARNLLYVLNAGGNVGASDNITGFVVGPDGKLSPLPDSTRSLSAASTGPAQVQFNSDGDVLVVTEKATDKIVTFTVDAAGRPSNRRVQQSAGATPFGFTFGKRDQLFVSNAAGGAQDRSSVSSYVLAENGELNVVSSAVGTTETAACWVVVTNDGRFAYTTNTGSGSVSGYSVAFDGSITLLDSNGRTGITGQDSTPIDMSLSNDGRNLYTLNSGNGTISAFRVEENGGLEMLRRLRGIPPSATGLAAR